MKFTERYHKMEFIKQLAMYKNTGTPKELAEKLNISERSVKRLINELKELGEQIVYCRTCNSYVYKHDLR